MPGRSDPVNQPKSLVATGRIQASINIPGYKDKFYGSKDDQFSLAPPTIDPNLKSLMDKETAWVKKLSFPLSLQTYGKLSSWIGSTIGVPGP